MDLFPRGATNDIDFSQIFSENFTASISSCEDHCRRPKSFKKHCLSCGKTWKSSTGKQNKDPRTLSKVDSLTKDLIRATIYEYYDQKICPTLNMLFEKIQEKTKGEDYEFPYGRTWLSKLVKVLGFCYCRSNNREVLMESIMA